MQPGSWGNPWADVGALQTQSEQFLGPQGQQNLTGGQRNLGSVANYDLGILSGNRNQILATESPEISSLLADYDRTRKAASQLQPRGGGRSALLNELPYKQVGDVNQLIQQARPRAAQQLAGVGAEQASIGLSEQELFSQNVGTTLSYLLGKGGLDLEKQQLNGQLGQAIGQAAMMALMAAG